MLRLIHDAPLHDADKIERPNLNERITLKVALKMQAKDVPNLRMVCHVLELELDETDLSSDYITLRGKLAALEKMFSITFYTYRCRATGSPFLSFEGVARIPLELASYTRAIFGLDTASFLRPYAAEGGGNAKLQRTFTPLQLARIYNFPEDEGEGQTIGIIALGGGYLMSDIRAFFSMLGITGEPRLVDVPVNSKNNPNSNLSSIETTLDVEILASLVPKATLKVYFCTGTSNGFYEGLRKAIKDDCSVISISWGSPEAKWSRNELEAFNALFKKATEAGITIVAAAGDNGSSDGFISTTKGSIHADFPSSSPYVLACGGTTLTVDEVTGKRDETVWNISPAAATGGGVSSFFIKPGYQSSFSAIGKRGIPDVCANADKNTGYRIIYQSKEMVIGGTSAAAPLWAGLITRINNLGGIRVGLPHSMFYLLTSKGAFNDIVTGNNGAYTAMQGWDPCSGLGSPNGTEILKLWMPAYGISKDSAKERLKPRNRVLNNPTVRVITVKELKKPSTVIPKPRGVTISVPPRRETSQVYPVLSKKILSLRVKHPRSRV